jgi:hypothetical protein
MVETKYLREFIKMHEYKLKSKIWEERARQAEERLHRQYKLSGSAKD